MRFISCTLLSRTRDGSLCTSHHVSAPSAGEGDHQIPILYLSNILATSALRFSRRAFSLGWIPARSATMCSATITSKTRSPWRTPTVSHRVVATLSGFLHKNRRPIFTPVGFWAPHGPLRTGTAFLFWTDCVTHRLESLPRDRRFRCALQPVTVLPRSRISVGPSGKGLSTKRPNCPAGLSCVQRPPKRSVHVPSWQRFSCPPVMLWLAPLWL